MNYKGMQYRITPRSRGGYVLEVGVSREEDIPAPSGRGFVMKGFFAYRSEWCETEREAKSIAKRLGAVPA